MDETDTGIGDRRAILRGLLVKIVHILRLRYTASR